MTKQQNTIKTWEDYYTMWMNEELEFEGRLWKDIRSIVGLIDIIVMIDKAEEREGIENPQYTKKLKEEVEAMKKELLEKWN